VQTSAFRQERSTWVVEDPYRDDRLLWEKLLNVLRLVAQEKPVVVYVHLERTFVEIRRRLDLPPVLAGLDSQTASRLWTAAAAEGLGERFVDLESLRF
jgi:hypothetical protein